MRPSFDEDKAWKAGKRRMETGWTGRALNRMLGTPVWPMSKPSALFHQENFASELVMIYGRFISEPWCIYRTGLRFHQF